MSYSNSWIKVDKLLYTSISGSITGETGVGILVDLPGKNIQQISEGITENFFYHNPCGNYWSKFKDFLQQILK